MRANIYVRVCSACWCMHSRMHLCTQIPRPFVPLSGCRCVCVNLAVPACFDHDACTRAHARVLFMECGIAGPCQLEHIHDNCGQGALYHQKVLVAFWEDVKKSRTALESVLPTFFIVFDILMAMAIF